MQATQAQLLKLLDGKRQLTIPIYQRVYSWQIKQCQQLFEDAIRVGSDEKHLSHFIGSIVYFQPDSSPVTSVAQLSIIDGQQRLTTVSLLPLSIVSFLKENGNMQLGDESGEEIKETYIINKHRTDDSKFKLLLTRKDKITYTKLVDGIGTNSGNSKRILDNYHFFKKKINRENIQAVYNGIKKMTIVDVSLERGRDDPQLIFESLNSTGLALSQADLIRNYILMNQTLENQNSLYNKYWYPMEQSFEEDISKLAYFIRDYLTIKKSSIPNINRVYEDYKSFLNLEEGYEAIEESVKDFYHYAKYYVRIALSKEDDQDLARKFKEVAKLKIDNSHPFLVIVGPTIY